MPSSHPAELKFWLDEPRAKTTRAAALCIKGWCFDVSGAKITAIRLRIGTRTYTAKIGITRPDVLAYYKTPASTLNSGFEVSLKLTATKSEVYLEAKRDSSDWTTFERLTLEAPLSKLVAFPFNKARFFISAYLGKDLPLKSLNDQEIYYLHHRFEESHGESPLSLTPQYNPRDPLKEKFTKSSLPIDALPQITIVTPSYNHAHFLGDTIDSVLNQENVRVNYIVQDGGSNDGSVRVIEKYKDKLTHADSSKDAGQADAIMKGFKHDKSEPTDIMAYLNSDDLLMPGVLRFVADYFAKHPEVDVIYGHRLLINEDGLEVGQWITPRQKCDNLALHDLIPQETLFWRKRIWDKVGGIDTRFQFALDWDLLIRFQETGAVIKRLPYFLGLFRIHTHQKSQSLIEQTGVPEMNLLRKRTLGRIPTNEEIFTSMRRAQIDSMVVKHLLDHGIRV